MIRRAIVITVLMGGIFGILSPSWAVDIDGVQEHQLVTRYPGQEIRWQQIENYLPYRVPVGKVSGYRNIDRWIETEGQVTRTFYRYQGTKNTYSEIYLNYLEAFTAAGFEILAQGFIDNRRGNEAGSRKWMDVLYIENPTTTKGEVGTMFSGSSSSGGSGAIVARKERADRTVYVVLGIEQHAADYVGTLIDIIEVGAAETGLVAVDAEAIGSGVLEYGRVILQGLFFEYDKAVLTPESEPVLKVIASYLKAHPENRFFVVGHTDSKGTFSYNHKLSFDRAYAVVYALQTRYAVDSKSIEAQGVGPLAPVFSNFTDAGRRKNRRVVLVER